MKFLRKTLFPIFFVLILFMLSFLIFGESKKIYEEKFDKRKGFSHTYECFYANGEYHIFNNESGYLCWQDLKRTPERTMIRARVITEDPESVLNSHNAGVLFRVANVSNSALFAVYPKGGEWLLGYWKDKNWITIRKEASSVIQLENNAIDLILSKDSVSAYINGQKVMEENLTQAGIPYWNNFTGFYASKGLHAHFKDLEIFEIGSDFKYSPPVKIETVPSLENDMPVNRPAYEDIDDEVFSYSFNSPKDSPFLENLNAHTERGKYILWAKNGYRAWNSSIAHEDVIVETSFLIKEEKGWAGLTLKQNKNQYYGLLINSFNGQIQIRKNENGQDKIFFDIVSAAVLKGEGVKNTVAFSVKENVLTAYVNGQKIKKIEDKRTLSSDGFGVITDGGGKAEFDYIRVFEMKKSFWEKISGWVKFFIFVGIIILIIRFFKRRKKKATQEMSKEMILKEVLKKMKDKKKKTVYDTDLIFDYQITRKEAEEILTELSSDYGGYFDYDDEGRMFVTFEIEN